MTSNSGIARVVFDLPFSKSFDYLADPELLKKIRVGSRVLAPFGTGSRTGFVIEITNKSSFKKLKYIKKLMDEDPAFTPELIKLAKWVSTYYMCSLGKVLKTMIPASVQKDFSKTGTVKMVQLSRVPDENSLQELGRKAPVQKKLLMFLNKGSIDLKKQYSFQDLIDNTGAGRSSITALEEKGWISIIEKKKESSIFKRVINSEKEMHVLTDEQNSAVKMINEEISSRNFSVLLLHGVTGSGKTEVYLQAVDYALKMGRNALLLVPEISLTPQMVSRVCERFGKKVALLHSKLTASERKSEWDRIKKGKAQVVIGVRSAVFAPLRNLGLIVVDEEQSRSYKQEESPRYHARDVAILRGKQAECPVVLGTATPAMETYYNMMQQKYKLIQIRNRVENRRLPDVHIVDMREEAQWQKGDRLFSRRLLNEIGARLEKKEQIILFLNRRGFAPFVSCSSCNHIVGCKDCNLTLTYHKPEHKCRCHTCGYQIDVPVICPECGKKTLNFIGTGTQRVEERIKKIFPSIRIGRMDTDAMQRKGSHEEIFSQFFEGQLDVLVGTQMIAKGLDVPRVTLVGVLQADVALSLPDFRSSEVTFQLLTQVSGRAGRGDKPGQVIIQTHTPEHPAVSLAAKQDYEAFYNYEIKLREELRYPPVNSFIDFRFRGKDLTILSRYASRFRKWLSPVPDGISFFGPFPAPVSKKKGMFELQIIFSTTKRGFFQKWLEKKMITFSEKNKKGFNYMINIDPVSMM